MAALRHCGNLVRFCAKVCGCGRNRAAKGHAIWRMPPGAVSLTDESHPMESFSLDQDPYDGNSRNIDSLVIRQ
jgi:hypothetical protein